MCSFIYVFPLSFPLFAFVFPSFITSSVCTGSALLTNNIPICTSLHNIQLQMHNVINITLFSSLSFLLFLSLLLSSIPLLFLVTFLLIIFAVFCCTLSSTSLLLPSFHPYFPTPIIFPHYLLPLSPAFTSRMESSYQSLFFWSTTPSFFQCL